MAVSDSQLLASQRGASVVSGVCSVIFRGTRRPGHGGRAVFSPSIGNMKGAMANLAIGSGGPAVGGSGEGGLHSSVRGLSLHFRASGGLCDCSGS